MSALTDFIALIKATLDRPYLDDAMVTSWVRMAESRINRELRCREMVDRDTANMEQSTVDLPGDWLETTYLKYAPNANAPMPDIRYGRSLMYVTQDEFTVIVNDPCHPDHKKSRFTVIGRQLLVNPNIGALDGTVLEIGYYAKVQPLGDQDNDVHVVHPDVYLYGTLGHSGLYLVEDDRVPAWVAQATDAITKVNDAWTRAKSSGSPLHIRSRSFG